MPRFRSAFCFPEKRSDCQAPFSFVFFLFFCSEPKAGLPDFPNEKSKKTGKIRHIYDGKTLIVNMRASDSFLILSKEGAKRLHAATQYPKNRVVVNKDSEPFSLEGKSVFAKFVVECDEDIRAKDEVLIVNEEDKLLAYGKALLGACEINDFQTGQAIKTRKGMKK